MKFIITFAVICLVLTLIWAIAIGVFSYACAESVIDGSAAKTIGGFIHDVKEAAEGEEDDDPD